MTTYQLIGRSEVYILELPTRACAHTHISL